MRRKIILTVIALGVLMAVTYLSMRAYEFYQMARQRQILLEERKDAWNKLGQTFKKMADGFNGDAAIIIKDLDTGLEFSLNENKVIPSASLVKVPVMAACFYAVEDGKLRLDEMIRLKNAHKVSGSGKLKDEISGKEYIVENLIDLMVSESDNTASNMLIERLGMDYLNACFKRMGLKNTNLSRKMMDFKSRRKGIENYTTARDIAYILEKIYRGALLNASVSRRCLRILANQKVKDRIPKKLPAGTVVAHKTGLENGICHDAGIVYTNNGNFLICVLTKHNNKFAAPAKKLIADISAITYWYYVRV